MVSAQETEECMTLDWQVLVIAFIALSLRLLAVSPGLHGVEIDGQLKGRNHRGHDSIKIAAARDR
jgi:hypothetical protein